MTGDAGRVTPGRAGRQAPAKRAGRCQYARVRPTLRDKRRTVARVGGGLGGAGWIRESMKRRPVSWFFLDLAGDQRVGDSGVPGERGRGDVRGRDGGHGADGQDGLRLGSQVGARGPAGHAGDLALHPAAALVGHRRLSSGGCRLRDPRCLRRGRWGLAARHPRGPARVPLGGHDVLYGQVRAAPSSLCTGSTTTRCSCRAGSRPRGSGPT